MKGLIHRHRQKKKHEKKIEFTTRWTEEEEGRRMGSYGFVE